MRPRRYDWVPVAPDRFSYVRTVESAEPDVVPRPNGPHRQDFGISCKTDLKPRFPPLGQHDELVLLLHGAAEIEHALLVQYLYAAYSLETDQTQLRGDVPDDAVNLIRMWRDSILTIAVQEMAHLLTVQNLLHFVGGPLNFEREDMPFKSDLYPFH